MSKSALTRWTETTNYLDRNFAHAKPNIGQHINSKVTGKLREKISNEISLGNAKNVHKSSAANKGARNALRALLLCQRFYFSDLWANYSFVGGDVFPDTTTLAPDWKMTSLAAWGLQPESVIQSAISMFSTVATATANDVSDVAKNIGAPTGRPPAIAGNLTYSRNNFMLTGANETCYRGVLAWLLKSGVISYRWFMQNHAPEGEDALTGLFGTGEVVWPGDTPFTAASVLPQVEKGFVVHMWMEEGNWNGHWVISNGDGTFCGVNNGEKNIHADGEVVLKSYTNTGTLKGQFLGYTELVTEKINNRGFLDIVKTGIPAKAHMVKFDPMTLKGRM